MEETIEGFEEFYEAHFSSVARAAHLVLGEADGAFDVAQESFARTWADWERVRKLEQPLFFTLKVARNLAKSNLRRRRRFLRIFKVFDESRERDSQSDLEALEIRTDLQDALRSLGPRERWVIVLTYLMDLTSNEAAAVLGISPSTVRVHLARAREKLRFVLSNSPIEQTGLSTHRGRRKTGGDVGD